MLVYKLTDSALRTHGSTFQWELNVPREISKEDHTTSLCSPGFFHWYRDPLLAIFHDPIHGKFGPSARLFEAEAEGVILEEGQMKGGSTKLTLLREIPLPQVTLEQRIKYGILCAMEVTTDEAWKLWATKWLSGEDRTVESARKAVEAAGARAGVQAALGVVVRAAQAARAAAWAAAWAAGKPLDLIAIAKKAVEGGTP